MYSVPRRRHAQEFFDKVNAVEEIEPIRLGDMEVDTIPYTIPDGARTKDVLQDLTYYHSYMERRKTKLMPLKVNMKIGNEPIEFVLTPGAPRQIKIYFKKFRDEGRRIEYRATTYNEIIRKLDSRNPAITRRNAWLTLNVIYKNTDATDVWKRMTPRQIEAAKELIVITHVAEPAVPISDDVKDILKKASSRPSATARPEIPAGGVGGVDKLVRAHLREIDYSKGEITFDEVFGDTGEFLMARQDGKRLFKEALYYKMHDSETRPEISRSISVNSSNGRQRRAIRSRG